MNNYPELWIWPEIIGAGSMLAAFVAGAVIVWLRWRKSERAAALVARVRDYGMNESVRAGCCPDCGMCSMIEGPRAGSAQNVACSACGSRFNVPPAPVSVERLAPMVPGQCPECNSTRLIGAVYFLYGRQVRGFRCEACAVEYRPVDLPLPVASRGGV